MNDNKKIFLLPAKDWPLFPVFWCVLIFGTYAFGKIISLIQRFIFFAFKPATMEAAAPVTQVAIGAHIVYTIFAFYAVFITRHNTEKKYITKIVPWFVAFGFPMYLLMFMYGGFFFFIAHDGLAQICMYSQCAKFYLPWVKSLMTAY